jgi:hypothetical protein
MEMSGQSQAPVALLLEYEPPVSTEQEAGRAPEPVWKYWRREKSVTFERLKQMKRKIKTETGKYIQ